MSQPRLSEASRWRIFGPVATSAIALGLFSSINRPLLYDEFVYFMVGPLSFTETLSVVRDTTTNVNQGVTGAYLFSDWLLLQIFGASDVALRLPSLVFGAAFLTYALIFLRLRGMGFVALTIFPIFMITQELVMHYVGEARTYMPLVASAVGLLAYYCAPEPFRKSPRGLAVAWSAAMIGVFFHPYIALYWPAVLLFGFLFFQRQHSLRNLASFANPVLVLTGVATYTAIAALTWIRGRANADVDPFNFLPGPLPVEILVQNLYAFVNPAAVALVAAAVISSLALTLIGASGGVKRAVRSLAKDLLPPAVLFLLAFLAALAISFTSIAADFWIFPRQWIASAALAAIAIFWASYVVIANAGVVSAGRKRLSAALLTVAVAVPASTVAAQQARDLIEWSARPGEVAPTQAQLEDLQSEQQQLTDGQWMPFAQVNADTGGRVWPEFRSYYLDTDWSTFFLQD